MGARRNGMFELTEEQLMVRNMCREFAEKELREQAIEIDRITDSLWKQQESWVNSV
jgi:alkylation response protein AidB-like acyl-CoA dehydrogenase